MNSQKLYKSVEIWLWIGLVMILIQILLGGITRLTGSGLSITRWDIVTGVAFPMNSESWEHQFELYKNTPQFQKINRDFTLEDFKFIYFWEYVHRLWARTMGFVFLFPFVWFIWRKKLDKNLIIDLIILVLLASFVASLGWIMVASGLSNRPWVNAYKLSFHLIAAVTTVSYLLYIILKRKEFLTPRHVMSKTCHVYLIGIIALSSIQLFLGGVVAGMKAAIVAPTWPSMNGKFIPELVFKISNYGTYLFKDYDLTPTGPLIVQFWHRTFAYIILVVAISGSYKWIKTMGSSIKPYVMGLFVLLFIQISLGVCTLLNSIGKVSLLFGVLHQAFGMVFFLYLLFLLWGPFRQRI